MKIFMILFSLFALVNPGGADSAWAETGRTAPPARIVLAGRAVNIVSDAVFLFPDAEDRVVASASADQGLGVFGELVDARFGEKPVLDRQAGAETLAAQKPDLVIMKNSMTPVLRKPLEALGIPVLSLSLETPEDWTTEILSLGQRLGSPERAEYVTSYFRNTYNEVLNRTASLRKRPTVLVLYVAAGNVYNVPPSGWMQTLVVKAAGGDPVWTGANPGSGWARVSFEQIAAWNPEFILAVSYQSDSSAAAAGLKSDIRFRPLRAAAADRILAFPQDYYSWDQSTSRWVLGLLWLSRRLHPDVFPTKNLLDEVKRFYHTLYGIDEKRFQEKILPRIRGDFGY